MVRAPEPCKQIRSSSMNRCSQPTTAAVESIAAGTRGRAIATTSAPNASALAASIPVRIPPEATSGTRAAPRAPRLAPRGRDARIGQIGIPQLAVADSCSTRDHEVPPAPATSIPDTGRSADRPQQFRGGRAADAVADFLEEHRTFYRAGRLRSLVQRAARSRVSPWRWIASCNGFVCTASASAPTRSSASQNILNSGRRQLGQANVAEQQHIRGYVTNDEAVRRPLPNALSSMIRCDPNIIPMPRR